MAPVSTARGGRIVLCWLPGADTVSTLYQAADQLAPHKAFICVFLASTSLTAACHSGSSACVTLPTEFVRVSAWARASAAERSSVPSAGPALGACSSINALLAMVAAASALSSPWVSIWTARVAGL